MIQEEIDKYELKLRSDILRRLADLKEKIETNEPLPEDLVQDIGFLVHVDDEIEKILNCWYY